jgi:hypothetical protein
MPMGAPHMHLWVTCQFYYFKLNGSSMELDTVHFSSLKLTWNQVANPVSPSDIRDLSSRGRASSSNLTARIRMI